MHSASNGSREVVGRKLAPFPGVDFTPSPTQPAKQVIRHKPPYQENYTRPSMTDSFIVNASSSNSKLLAMLDAAFEPPANLPAGIHPVVASTNNTAGRTRNFVGAVPYRHPSHSALPHHLKHQQRSPIPVPPKGQDVAPLVRVDNNTPLLTHFSRAPKDTTNPSPEARGKALTGPTGAINTPQRLASGSMQNPMNMPQHLNVLRQVEKEPTASQMPFAAQIHRPSGGINFASGSGVRLEDTADEDEGEDSDALDAANVFNSQLDAMLGLVSDPRFDNDGDFYGRGKDTFVGPTARADDIDKFLRAAGNAELFNGNASIDKTLEKLGLTGMYQLLPGMTISLMPHQLIGVAWALDKERSHDKGGILADEMGLGKTVQIIAVMVTNVPQDVRCKTTLIVAPTSLLDQWKLEIEMKTNNGMTCLIYHGPGKPKNRTVLMSYDVVLTTYHTLAQEWPDFEAEQMLKEKRRKIRKKKNDTFIETDSEDERKYKKKKKQLGLLYEIGWYRVILDEAQNIRNKTTRNSRCVTDLDSVHRWCLTGTPIINGLTDAYPLFRFLKVRPWYDWADFNAHISKLEKKQPSLATARLQSIFQVCLLRRKKDSTLDGKKLIELPPKNVEMLKLTFSQEELDIYKMVEARSQARFNRFLRAGTVLKNYSQVLVMLLRLRQICSHPALIQEDGDALIAPDADSPSNPSDFKEELARARRIVSFDFVLNMRSKYKQAALHRIQDEKKSADASAEDEECPVCMDAFTDAVITPCGHAFCRECLVNVLNTPSVQDINDPQKYKPDEKPCPSCRSPVCSTKIFTRAAFEPSDADLEAKPSGGVFDDSDEEMPSVSQSITKRHERLKKKRDVDCQESDDSMSDFIVQSDEDEAEKDARRAQRKRTGKGRVIIVDSDDEGGSEAKDVIHGKKNDNIPIEQVKMMPRFLPSTKMKKMMEYLHKWANEHPGEKTLVISQWTQCLQLVSNYLAEHGILHVKYQGDMNRVKRDQAVRVFMSGGQAQVMLMSLKCGGVGLNLTRANRVISLDLGWSEAIESQAFDRVHRLGQTKEVFVQRLVIADTVEDRVLSLQERKKNLADGSLGEGNGKKIGRLSVRELANLFGLDHKGNLL